MTPCKRRWQYHLRQPHPFIQLNHWIKIWSKKLGKLSFDVGLPSPAAHNMNTKNMQTLWWFHFLSLVYYFYLFNSFSTVINWLTNYSCLDGQLPLRLHFLETPLLRCNIYWTYITNFTFKFFCIIFSSSF